MIEEKISINVASDIPRQMTDIERAIHESVSAFGDLSKMGTRAFFNLETQIKHHGETLKQQRDEITKSMSALMMARDDMIKSTPGDLLGLQGVQSDIDKTISKMQELNEVISKEGKGYRQWTGGKGYRAFMKGLGEGGEDEAAAGGRGYGYSRMVSAAGGVDMEHFLPSAIGAGSNAASLGLMKAGPVGAVAAAALSMLGVGSLISGVWSQHSGLQGARLGAVGGIGGAGLLSADRFGGRFGYTQMETPGIASAYAQSAMTSKGMEAAFALQRGAGVGAGQSGGYVGALTKAGMFGASGPTDTQIYKMVGGAVRMGMSGGTIRQGEFGALGGILQGIQTVVEQLKDANAEGGGASILGLGDMLAKFGKSGAGGYNATFATRPMEVAANLNASIQGGMNQGGPSGQAFFYRSMINNYPGMQGGSATHFLWEMQKRKDLGITDPKTLSAIGKQFTSETKGRPEDEKNLYLRQLLGPQFKAPVIEKLTKFFEAHPEGFGENEAKKEFGPDYKLLMTEAEKNAQMFSDVVGIQRKMLAIAEAHADDIGELYLASTDFYDKALALIGPPMRFLSNVIVPKEGLVKETRDHGVVLGSISEMVKTPDGKKVVSEIFGFLLKGMYGAFVAALSEGQSGATNSLKANAK
jgi:hypothetical protein